jgi:hypothetical protein
MKSYAGGSHGKGNRSVQSGMGNKPVAKAGGNRFPAGKGK